MGSVLSLWRERLELDIDSDGRRWFTETRDPERILVVARSLAGDADAVEQVREARSALSAHHDWRGARHEREERKEWLQIRSAPLAPDDVARVSDLVVVHTTSFPPPRSADGMVCLQTRFDATGYPRASLHFTLNHAVTSHLYGNWNDAGYVVVAPLGDAIDRNGPPENLNGVDTWWELDPGRAVVLPGAVVIQHDPNASELISRVGDTVTVKAANFTEAEIEQLMAAEVIDSDDIWGPVAVPMGAEPSSAQEVEARRTAKIAEGARKLATQRIVESMGARLATGGMWESSLERSIKPLAAELGCGAGPHCNSPTFNAEIDRYNGLEETSDPRLWLASPAVLRVVAATGFLAPRPALVRERDQVRSGPYIPLE